MTNPMANPDPVPQRFAEVPASGSDSPTVSCGPDGVTEEDVLEALRDVIDPELGINIVDLGLVYGVNFAADGSVTLDMTLTSAACPLTDVIENQAQMMLTGMVKEARVNWVWMPPWGPDRITEEGREQLRALGFNV